MGERIIVSQAEFAAAGYKGFSERLKEGQFYEGSWQKRIDDEVGKRYFITVSLWQFPNAPMSAQAEVQFHDQDDMRGEFCNVSRSVEKGIPAMEAFFHDLWVKLGFGYYERFGYVQTPSPRLQHGGGAE